MFLILRIIPWRCNCFVLEFKAENNAAVPNKMKDGLIQTMKFFPFLLSVSFTVCQTFLPFFSLISSFPSATPSVRLRNHQLYPLQTGKISLKMSVLGITLNCIRCWDFSPGALGHVEYFLITITLRSTLNCNGCICKSSTLDHSDKFENC